MHIYVFFLEKERNHLQAVVSLPFFSFFFCLKALYDPPGSVLVSIMSGVKHLGGLKPPRTDVLCHLSLSRELLSGDEELPLISVRISLLLLLAL